MEIVTNNRTMNRNGSGDLYQLMIRSEHKGLVLKMLALPRTQSAVEISLGFCCHYQKYNIFAKSLSTDKSCERQQLSL